VENNKRKSDVPADCDPSAGCCGPGDPFAAPTRREFLAATAGALAAAAGRDAFAGPFVYLQESALENDYLRLIPADKKLSPAWVASLTARGEPKVYKGDDLDRIGMPVGGLCAGQMYLSGDGRLWLWDVMNQYGNGVGGRGQNGENYISPLKATSPVEEGFAIRTNWRGATAVHTLDRIGFPGATFRGEYPIGKITFSRADCPVEVTLEAFSPFCPLELEDSSLPATILQYEVFNGTKDPVEVELAGWLRNPVCLGSRATRPVRFVNRMIESKDAAALLCEAVRPPESTSSSRPDVVFANFEGESYGDWKAEGLAFGDRPSRGSAGVQKLSGFEGRGVVNSYANSDEPKGKLVSPQFTIDRNYINFLIGGGAHREKTCIRMVIGGEVVATATGRNSDQMDWASFDVREHRGKTARLEIVDDESGGWGHIDIDRIEFSDRQRLPRSAPELEAEGDFGTVCLGIVRNGVGSLFGASTVQGDVPHGCFYTVSPPTAQAGDGAPVTAPGCAGARASLAPGARRTFTFVLAWHFPNLRLPGFAQPVGRHYAARFESAHAVFEYIRKNLDALAARTRLWRDTWYDSTLPYWLLDRTFSNTSILATSTCYRFRDGRFWAFEGVGCCHGTCTHVWNYAWAMGRTFPELEHLLRERTEYGAAFDETTGIIAMRGEFDRSPAVDGQAGVILRTWRDHLMSKDSEYLKKYWSKAKRAMQYLIQKDTGRDGILDGDQPNTLDAAWFGKISWISSLYVAALRACELMAAEMGDAAFSAECAELWKKGSTNITKELFNGEFYTQIPDPAHLDAIGADHGCHVDQVFGQSWAWHAGLGRILPEKETVEALRSLYKYNFAPDVGPFRAAFKEGRPYALAGDGGLLMCTWPKGGKREDWKKHWQTMYFNECMSGFEWQAAAHMVWEGLVTEGLAVARAIHDRYDARLRNPYNEIECSDHYSRAMASYGLFLAVCGFELHGPKQQIGFAPRLSPADFRCPFVAPEGFGTYSQKSASAGTTEYLLEVRHGALSVRTLSVEKDGMGSAASVEAWAGGVPIHAGLAKEGRRAVLAFGEALRITPGKPLRVILRP
jgi:uncharacterized protein (DUF608 family)